VVSEGQGSTSSALALSTVSQAWSKASRPALYTRLRFSNDYERIRSFRERASTRSLASAHTISLVFDDFDLGENDEDAETVESVHACTGLVFNCTRLEDFHIYQPVEHDILNDVPRAASAASVPVLMQLLACKKLQTVRLSGVHYAWNTPCPDLLQLLRRPLATVDLRSCDIDIPCRDAILQSPHLRSLFVDDVLVTGQTDPTAVTINLPSLVEFGISARDDGEERGWSTVTLATATRQSLETLHIEGPASLHGLAATEAGTLFPRLHTLALLRCGAARGSPLRLPAMPNLRHVVFNTAFTDYLAGYLVHPEFSTVESVSLTSPGARKRAKALQEVCDQLEVELFDES